MMLPFNLAFSETPIGCPCSQQAPISTGDFALIQIFFIEKKAIFRSNSISPPRSPYRLVQIKITKGILLNRFGDAPSPKNSTKKSFCVGAKNGWWLDP
jgi:hypothetical protein